jgi:hypothetical protein
MTDYAARERSNKVYESELFARNAKMAAFLLSKTDESAESIIKAMQAAEADRLAAQSKAPPAPAATPNPNTMSYAELQAAGLRAGGDLLHGAPESLALLPDGLADPQMQQQGNAVARMLLSKIGVLPSGGVGSREAA